MSDAFASAQETARLAAMQLLDLEAARPSFERIARLAKAAVQTPVAVVAFVEADKLWLAGITGVDAPGRIERDYAFADWTIRGREVLWVEDATRDTRFSSHPLVSGGPKFRFYAGAPICLTTGEIVGAMTVFDTSPRAFDAATADQLKDLAALVADEWERRRSLIVLSEQQAETEAANRCLAEIIESAPAALLMTDRSMNVLRASRVWREDMQVSADITGQCIYDLFPGSRERWSKQYERCLAGEVIHGPRVRLTLPGGARPWARVHMTPWRDGQGEIGGLLIMTQDISDIVESLEKVERSERRLLMATELAKLSVWEFDIPRAEVSVKGPAAKGRKSSNIAEAAEKIWDLVHPDDRAAAKAAWQAHLDHGTPYRTTYRNLRRDGTAYWFQAASEAIRDEAGNVERVVGVGRDIDEEKRAEVAMAKALQDAEAANRAKSEFLANMSHEIRTPLNGVLGVAGALSKTALDADQREMVGVIESSAQILGRLLGDILDLARIESGRLTLRNECFDLAEALRATVALFEPEARAKGLHLELRMSGALETPARGDAARLRQIVSNLLSNAIKFTEAGDVIVTAKIKASAGKLKLKLAVADTGIGFDPAETARLFGRFEQLDGSITRRAGGAGMGLPLSRSLAEAMGGVLSATSRIGEGSTFTVDLEFGCINDALETAPDGQAAPRRGLRVLLAEDHPTNRKVVELILGSVGVELVSVENGAEAVEAAKVAGFDLVLMDMQMPVMDGLTATRLIREWELANGQPRLPILCLTANAMPEHVEASRAAGADVHLTKPISAASLVEAVRLAADGGYSGQSPHSLSA